MPQHLRVGLVDMNNGVPNEAIRCFRRIITAFVLRARHANPDVQVDVVHVQGTSARCRPATCDLVLSTGGPGVAPSTATRTRGARTTGASSTARSADANPSRAASPAPRSSSCATRSRSRSSTSASARMARRLDEEVRPHARLHDAQTASARRSSARSATGSSPGSTATGRPLDLDPRCSACSGGELWAVESRPGGSGAWKGDGLLAFKFAAGIEGTQFHPEADREGALAWIKRPEQAHATDRGLRRPPASGCSGASTIRRASVARSRRSSPAGWTAPSTRLAATSGACAPLP